MQSNTSKEDKQVDDALDSLIQRIQQIRAAVTALIMKLENEFMTLNWLNVLDNFALISGEINSLTRLLKSAKMPPFKNYAIIPLALSPIVDPELQNATEGRVPMFTHEVAPAYLRTKPFPEVEDKVGQMQIKAGNMTQENINKHINTLNKFLNNVQEAVKSRQATADSDLLQKSSIPQLASQNDTNLLISAITFGKGLKSHSAANTGMPGGVHQPIQDQRMSMPATPQSMGGLDTGKAPSTVRTTIKAASNILPYPR